MKPVAAKNIEAIGKQTASDILAFNKVLKDLPLMSLIDAYLYANGAIFNESIDELLSSDELDVVIDVYNILNKASREHGGGRIALNE